MREKILVLDASVVIKWFSKEKNSEKAIEIRDRFVDGDVLIVCPDLIIYEVSNALRYAKALDKKDVKEAVESLYDLEIDIIVPTRDIIRKAIELAIDHDITVYDAVYVSLAELLDARLVTSDEKLIKASRQLKSVISLNTLRT